MQTLSGRHTAGIGIGLAVGLFLGVGIQAHSKPPQNTIVAETIRARTFELIGTDGNTYATLHQATDGYPSFDLRDKSGITRASLSIVQDGRTLLDFKDARGNTRQALQVNADGSSALMFVDAETHARTDVGLKTGGVPYLTLAGKTGVRQVSLDIDGQYQQATLQLSDSENKRRGAFAVSTSNGTPNLFLVGADPLTNATLNVWDDRLPMLSLNYQNAKRSLSLGDDQNKNPTLFLKNNNVLQQFPPQK